jgi:hemerythrin-like domain-containing protein
MSDIFAALRQEHQALLLAIDELRAIADGLDELPEHAVRHSLDGVYHFLTHRLKRHAAAEENTLYPLVGRILGSPQATATMSRDHIEVSRLADQMEWLLSHAAAFDLEQRKNLRRMLYGLHTLLKVHFVKEEEIYFPLLKNHLSRGEANRLLGKMAESSPREDGPPVQ